MSQIYHQPSSHVCDERKALQSSHVYGERKLVSEEQQGYLSLHDELRHVALQLRRFEALGEESNLLRPDLDVHVKHDPRPKCGHIEFVHLFR